MKFKPKANSERRESARRGRLHNRAKRRARQRLAIEEQPVRLTQRIGWSVTEATWTFQEKVFWPLSDVTRAAADAVRWPFEQVAWAFQRKVTWPISDRLASSSQSGRLAGNGGRVAAGALCVLAVGAATAGAFVAKPGGSDPVIAAAEPAQVAQVPEVMPEPIVARTEPEPEGPVLEGVRPTFQKADAGDPEVTKALRMLRAENAGQGGGETGPAGESSGPSQGSGGNAAPEGQSDPNEGTESGEDPSAAQQGDQATASRSARNRPLMVAQRFATAFVAYEVGQAGEETDLVFRQTASQPLVKSLADRPPRQPAGEGVPKARVYNVVAGPRKNRKLAVSVGLLRVDGVAELRLDMERTQSGWRVATVRG